jgi:hypothetical protein
MKVEETKTAASFFSAKENVMDEVHIASTKKRICTTPKNSKTKCSFFRVVKT